VPWIWSGVSARYTVISGSRREQIREKYQRNRLGFDRETSRNPARPTPNAGSASDEGSGTALAEVIRIIEAQISVIAGRTAERTAEGEGVAIMQQ
jgi:hypothetical protein